MRSDVGGTDSGGEVLWQDDERVVRRAWRYGPDGGRHRIIAVMPTSEHPAPNVLHGLTHEYGLKVELDAAWAVRPLELVRELGRTILVLESPEGEPLDRLIGPPMGVEKYLQLGIGLSVAVGRLHERGLIHKDIKPTNILANSTTGQ